MFRYQKGGYIDLFPENNFQAQKLEYAEVKEKSIMLSSGYRMPLVGLGTWQINDEESVRTAIEAAVEAGYRHIDTALAYQNEAFIGKALRNLFNQRKVRREDMFIVTKPFCCFKIVGLLSAAPNQWHA
ncbi:aldo-keto reductase family 1 member B7-like [Stegodyphus dumicola]|uniref:aldo-keto reductase family 1 member B7-like n=1 Tax=Stegodyphus dumicola TaxID=202533 RepID=UPI0015AF4424|nr:aldo-keto reductase family 1 member B7-like [Stegodyphus dumicola]